MVVVLPAPFGPRNPKISPAPTEKPIPRTASTSPYVLVRSSTSMTARHAEVRIRRRRIGGGAAVAGGRSAWARAATHDGVARRERAGRIGRARVAEQRERLAPAAAEIRVPLVAGPARLRHPGVAAIRPQRGRVAPDRRQRPRPDGLEGEPGDAARLVARQHHAVGRDDDVAPRPAVHARARAIRVVVGAHEQDLDLAAQPLGGGGRDGARLFDVARARGSSASRFASAQPRYCVFASSSRSAPIRSASATNSLTRAMLPRWITTFSVSGRPSARTAAATSSLPSRSSRPAIHAAPCASTSWIESCTLSRPAAASPASRARSAGMPLVIRLT